MQGKRVQIRLIARQVAKNASYVGGFIASLLPSILQALPAVLEGHKSAGDGLYLHKNSKCYRVQKMKGDGLYLSPSSRLPTAADGLFLKHGGEISDCSGLLMGKTSPFKNIPVLGWLLNYIFRRDV